METIIQKRKGVYKDVKNLAIGEMLSIENGFIVIPNQYSGESAERFFVNAILLEEKYGFGVESGFNQFACMTTDMAKMLPYNGKSAVGFKISSVAIAIKRDITPREYTETIIQQWKNRKTL